MFVTKLVDRGTVWCKTVSSIDKWIDLLVQYTAAAEEVADRVDTIVMWVMVSHVDADAQSCCFINAVCGVIQSLRQPVGYKAGVIIGHYLYPFDLKALDIRQLGWALLSLN